ncbi:MAG: hypothetical protein ACLFNQ_12280 [Spirochaetaceae bacterium]
MDLLALLLFNTGILLLMFLYFRRRIDRELSAERAIEKVRTEIGQLVAEMNKTTERNITLIEDRVRRAGAEIDRADRSLSALSRVRETTERSVETYNELGRIRKPETRPQPQDTVPTEVIADKPEKRRTMRDSAVELHSQGVPVDEIASRLGGTIAEIELMVGLGPTQRRSKTDT